jgi:hypothetical protein
MRKYRFANCPSLFSHYIKKQREKQRDKKLAIRFAKKLVKTSIHDGMFFALYGRFDENGDFRDTDSDRSDSLNDY